MAVVFPNGSNVARRTAAQPRRRSHLERRRRPGRRGLRQRRRLQARRRRRRLRARVARRRRPADRRRPEARLRHRLFQRRRARASARLRGGGPVRGGGAGLGREPGGARRLRAVAAGGAARHPRHARSLLAVRAAVPAGASPPAATSRSPRPSPAGPQRNGCRAEARAHRRCRRDAGIADGTQVVRHDYAGCAAGGALQHLEVVGNGHFWPDGHAYARLALLGGTLSRQLDASRAIVEFLGHTRGLVSLVLRRPPSPTLANLGR